MFTRQTKMVFVLALLFVLVFGGLFGRAEGAVIFFDDFESYDVGSFPSSGGWTIVYNGAGNAEQYIDNTHAASGQKSFRSMGGSSCWAASLSKRLSIPSRVRFEAKVFVDHFASGGCSIYNALLGLWKDNDSMWAGNIFFGSDGNIYATTQTGGAPVLLTSYSAGRWYDVRVDYDYSAKKFNVYIDGSLVGQDIPILDDLTNNMPNAVRVGAGHGYYPVAWFDDVRVTDLSTCTTPPSGMVAWWKAEGNANDSVGTNHGTLMNGATFAPGMVGQAFSFDGVDDYVDVGSIDLINKSFSFDVWVKRLRSGTNEAILAQGNSVNSQGLLIGFRANNKFTFDFYWDWLDVDTPTDTLWHHWAGTFDATTKIRKIYLDGVEVGSNTAIANYQGSGPLWIGRSPWSDRNFVNGAPINGYVDEVRIYDRVLSPDEIAAIYHAGSAGICSQPVTLTVTESGAGSGTVSASGCTLSWSGKTGTCQAPAGTQITLTAIPSSNSTFAGWSGACYGTGPCTITLNSDTSVNATFKLKTFVLRVKKKGLGSGEVNATGCTLKWNGVAWICSAPYGREITLTGIPADNSTFGGWLNGTGSASNCTGKGTCTFRITENSNVTASFNLKNYVLKVFKSGTGNGSVTAEGCTLKWNGVSAWVCTARHGTDITLRGVPAQGFTFVGWANGTGSASGCTGKNPCTFTLTENSTVRARFR